MLSLKQVESNHGKREPANRVAIGLFEFQSHCLNFRYCKYGIIIFSIQTQNGCISCTQEEKNL